MSKQPRGSTAPALKALARKRSSKTQKISREQQIRERRIEEGQDEIRADVVYPMAVFQVRSKLGNAGVRKAERDGLEIDVVGNERYVRGEEWLRFLREKGPKAKAGA